MHQKLLLLLIMYATTQNVDCLIIMALLLISSNVCLQLLKLQTAHALTIVGFVLMM